MIQEYEIIGKGSQISSNQKRENNAFSLLIGQNFGPFPDNFVLYLGFEESVEVLKTKPIWVL